MNKDTIYRQEIDVLVDELARALSDMLNGLQRGRHYTKILEDILHLPSAQPEIIRCKECKHFEYNHPYIIQGMPVLGHEVCNAWGDGCKTEENGFCFMAERRTDAEIH